jgi:hypothetical protein
MNAELRITVKDRKGVTEIYSVVNTVSGAIENAQLLARVALPVRMVHQAALAQTRDSDAPGLPAAEHELFLCACGDAYFTTNEAIAHVELDHASAKVRADIDQLENTIEALITPSPLVS